MPMKLEVFIDKKPHGYAFEGGATRRQMTEADVIAMFAPKDGEKS
jgi:phage terminase large subunit-like protein